MYAKKAKLSMVDLTPLQAHVLAYWLAHGASDFAMVGRWWPRGELAMMVSDKMRHAVRPFGAAAQGAAAAAGEAYLGHMIEHGGFANKDQKFGGTMHQYQAEGYRDTLESLKADNAVLKAAAGKGGEFWSAAFAVLAEQGD